MEPVRVDDAVRRLWSLCSVLRDEGVTYHEYLSELTYPLFLKLAENLRIEHRIPTDSRWETIRRAPANEVLARYRQVLQQLSSSDDALVKAIFSAPTTRIRTPAGVARLVAGIDDIDWKSIGGGTIGDVYEGLIQKSAQESRYGAGQYFTPRPLVEAIVTALRPTPDDSVYDPAAGTAGFLVAAGLSGTRGGQRPKLFGVELATDVHRLALVNLLLHGLDAEVNVGDALTSRFPPTTTSVCVTNPPFGVKGNVTPEEAEHLDFVTSSKQLAFLQHVYSRLALGGRAAIIVPDNVLFETGVAKTIRTHLLDNFDVHTVLKLPTGIFYATGVKASVLFFNRPSNPDMRTENVWFYDLRNGGRSFTRRHALKDEDFQDFLRSYGKRADGRSKRRPSERFHVVAREGLLNISDRLDIGPRNVGVTENENSPTATLQLLQGELDAAGMAVGHLIEMVGSDPPRNGDR
jgi:type I restriction enzyme M protein